MSFYSLMNKYKWTEAEQGSESKDDYTHVSMFPYGGRYKIPNENIEDFYNQYNLQIRAGAKYGILERPKNIGPMLVDIDIVKPSEKRQSLYTKERVMVYAMSFQKYLASHTDIVDHTKLECYVLEKKPYLDNKGNCKNGFHLHFPFVWMTREHRSLITKLVKELNIEQEYETLDDSAVRNNWFLYRSRKTDTQGSYTLKYSINVDGSTNLKKTVDGCVRTLSIRNNLTGITNKVLDKFIEKRAERSERIKPRTSLDDSLLTRCMESLDSSRSDDYHEWIKIGCILYTVDKENGFQRWNDFSKQSYKYDEDYLTKTWSRFKDYNYTIGSLIYLAREDDNKFSIRKVYKRRELLEMCKDKGIKAFTSKSVSELCNLLCLPPQEGNGKRVLRRAVALTNVETNETQTFKSIYSAAKFLGRNPGSISIRKNTGKIIKSVFDNIKYTVEIQV